MMPDKLAYQIALTITPGIGSVHARTLLENVDDIEELFAEKPSVLGKIPRVSKSILKSLRSKETLLRAEKEIEFIQKNNINTCFLTESNYPRRLVQCTDAPVLLYSQGNCDLNRQKVISIVGTRHATPAGRENCENLVAGLRNKGYDVLIVSGLAYGIDICAHQAALANQLDTIGVVAHGLDKLYPSQHYNKSREIINQGALVTEFLSQTELDPRYFVRRNRIIAGLADATIVIESANKGGSLITADIANSYNRDVFAFPGRASDKYSAGCNMLIKTNQAILIESADDLEYFLGWEPEEKKKEAIQPKLFVELSSEEQVIYDCLRKEEQLPMDVLASHCKMPISRVSTCLLNLEMNGLVETLPGNLYRYRN
ncbi:DNA-protecting protein DprA [Puteibacter caeruleilacunae]|nr:DNA-protecting protein DprA [Puteibacter caeruleilacunae]